ncbi:RHS repeat-associated core domain-containing protein, partial [Streptomyces sp. SID7982]|nr:RHS repeat-associated core domain-containing protein [Streptomyces sp. SID7982]
DQPRPHALSSTETTRADGTKSGNSYTYDPAGNTQTRTVEGKKQTFDWDNPEGTLAKVTEADGTTTSYLNDADGNRLVRRDKTGTTLYLGETELRLDKTSGKVEATRYYTHGGKVVAVRTPDALIWTASDHNGTAGVQVDAANQRVVRRQMTPFGEARGPAPQAWAGTRGFVNGTQDPTGLTHLGAREYDPSTGRFISVDPIADLKDPQQINGYAYSNNNPVTFADPDGKFFGAIFAIIRAIIRLINAIITYVSNQRGRSSGSGGMTTMGSASHVSTASASSGGGDSCPLVKRNYGICDSNE